MHNCNIVIGTFSNRRYRYNVLLRAVEVAAVASEPEHRAAAVCWWCQQVGGHQTPDIWTVSLSACLQTFVNHKTSEE